MGQTDQIVVTVAGAAGAGKSTVARAIELALVGPGLSVDRVDENGFGEPDMSPGVIEATWEKRIAAMVAHETRVIVRTQMISHA